MEKFTILDIVFTTIGIALIIAWMVGLVFWLQKLIKNYTLKDWGNKTNPYEKETLGLPRGTLRGVLTLTLLIVVVILVCTSMVVKPLRGGFESLVDAFQVMLAFYFGSKVMHHVTRSDKKKSESKSKSEADALKAKYAAASPSGTLKESDFEVSDAQG
ncbi:MAG: hypothetical protein GQ564_20015 [Bacteroidales bacterium]|nr:hypothetical protein [Bacteroidales bacterium]